MPETAGPDVRNERKNRPPRPLAVRSQGQTLDIARMAEEAVPRRSQSSEK
jgi:hypothetical protein